MMEGQRIPKILFKYNPSGKGYRKITEGMERAIFNLVKI
jgi:hypothetical protein